MIIFTKKIISALLITVTLTGCNPSESQKKDKKEDKKNEFTGYDMANPDEFNMPESLFEISGIAFNKGKSDTIYAIQDEE